jgi:hypothetical protein
METEALRCQLGSGDLVDLRTGDPQLDDPAASDQWASDRDVPADLVAELLTVPPEGILVRRQLRLAGARITGTLDLHTATLTRSLLLHQCRVIEPIVLNDADALALGFPGSHVQGVDATGIRCRSDLILSHGFTAEGEVRLPGAQIGGVLSCIGATFRNPGGTALSAYLLTAAQGMVCRGGFTAEGEVNLNGAQIGGVLDFTGGATFRNPGGIALMADNLTVGKDMVCSGGCYAEGEVRLPGAQIGGVLDFTDATFRNPGGTALSAYLLTAAQGMLCCGAFTAEGEVGLQGAQIGGILNFNGATFRNPGGTALSANLLTVAQGMFCRGGFTAEGGVNLNGAHIGGVFDFTGATFRNPEKLAVDLERAAINGNVFMRPTVLDGYLDLTFATVGGWRDDARTWPDSIMLLGFTYASIDANPAISPTGRLRWLRRDPAGYLPQPYEQLASVYRREGHDEAARQVLIAKQRRRRASHPSRWRRWPAGVWSWLLWGTIGYGYRPWRVLWPAVGLLLLGWWLFDLDHRRDLISPATDEQPAPVFHAARYTADLLLPVANLGERAKFLALGEAAWHAFAFTLSGWLLAIVLVAGLTGIFKRD